MEVVVKRRRKKEEVNETCSFVCSVDRDVLCQVMPDDLGAKLPVSTVLSTLSLRVNENGEAPVTKVLDRYSTVMYSVLKM